jgi:DegV family protein with EDD domain
LSPAQIAQHNITVIPLIVIKDDQEYRDGVTITAADVFAHVAAGGNLCSTAALNYGIYQEYFEKYASEYDGVVHISLGSGFSSSYQNACLAADEFDNVIAIDSMNLSTGQGHVVLEACRLAKEVESLAELKEKLDAFTPRVEASFLVDKLNYLAKGGRCSAVAALGANLLNLKPCIEVKNGKMSVVKKYRGSYAKCLASYVKDRLNSREDIIRNELFLTYTTVTDECRTAVVNAIEQYGNFENVYETQAGCTVSCHCGPDTLGILFVRK